MINLTLRFCYYGTEKRNDDKGKTNDERHLVLKEIYNGEGNIIQDFMDDLVI